MASFNKVILMGRLTADPELKQTPSGTSVTTFCLAVDRKYTREGQEKQCDFINCQAWRGTAEFICKYFGKGQAMLVCGELQTRTWEDSQGNKRYATEVVVGDVNFCESKKSSEDHNNTAPTSSASQSGNTGAYGYNSCANATPNFETMSADDDLPF